MDKGLAAVIGAVGGIVGSLPGAAALDAVVTQTGSLALGTAADFSCGLLGAGLAVGGYATVCAIRSGGLRKMSEGIKNGAHALKNKISKSSQDDIK